LAEEQEKQEGKFLLPERRRRQFMGGMVEVDKATLAIENSELTITLPTASQSRARRVDIEAGNGRSGNGRARAAEAPGCPRGAHVV
jgi:hypothetical protein